MRTVGTGVARARRSGKIAVSAVVAVLAIASATACGGSSSHACTADDVKIAGGFGQAPTIAVPDGCDAPTALVTKDLVTGAGPAAAAGDDLTINYSLVTWSHKKQVDSTFGAGPFTLRLGDGDVMAGWDQGLAGIKQGGRRLLIVPPALGFGAQGQGDRIGPNETLVYVTDAVTVQHGG